MSGPATETYQFKPHERPLFLGSSYSPEHPPSRMFAYGAIGILAGLTGGLGNALITANLGYVQGQLGISPVQAAWLPVAYVATNVCANLVLVKWRQQFGLRSFLLWMLIAYAALTVAHLFVHEFWTALLLRGASGIAASGLITLAILSLLQAFPAPKRLIGIMIGISVPQLAIPIARGLAPELLEWGDWRMAYFFELGMALATLAAVLLLPLPPSDRSKVFEKTDLLTIALLFPAAALLSAVLGLGRIVWWTEAEWIGWALIGAILLGAAGLWVEHRRANPLLTTRWLSRREILRIATVAIFVRILVSEQTFGAIGLLTTLGMSTDQFATLYQIVALASFAGLVVAIVTFRPATPGRAIFVACLFIAAGAFLDAGSTNLTRPANMYFSQALVAFGALLFLGPAMVIGVSRVLISGQQNFIGWVVLFNATQNLGGLAGSAFFGTFQTLREKYHSHELVQQIVLTNPIDTQRIAAGARAVSGLITDPALQAAQGAAQLSAQVTREANILAYNDVFLLIGVLACLGFVWGVSIQRGIRRRGEPSPVVLLAQRLAAAAAASQASQGR